MKTKVKTKLSKECWAGMKKCTARQVKRAKFNCKDLNRCSFSLFPFSQPQSVQKDSSVRIVLNAALTVVAGVGLGHATKLPVPALVSSDLSDCSSCVFLRPETLGFISIPWLENFD